MDAKTYNNITPKRFAKIRSLLAAKGVVLGPGNQGVIKSKQFGVDLSFNYDGKDLLTIKIDKKPFVIPAAMIWREMEKAFAVNIVKPETKQA